MRKRYDLIKKFRGQKKRGRNETTTAFLEQKYKTLRNRCVQLLRKSHREHANDDLRSAAKRETNPWKLIERLKKDDMATIHSAFLMLLRMS